MRLRRFVLTGTAAMFLLLVTALPGMAATNTRNSTADHSKFEVLAGPFEDGPAVTRACLTCHTEAARQIHQTKHWTWQLTHPQTGETLGKRVVINSFCGSIETNYARCTSCHVGYGWKDASFDFSSEDHVDCLVCHDTTGGYKKFPTGAGHPTYQDKAFPPGSNRIWKAPDLALVAQHVGKSSRASCGVCHFYGGGGDGVKHGDLDSSMTHPDKALDVHMGTDGLDFSCGTCHEADGHDVTGSRYTTVAKDTHGIDVPGRDDGNRTTCESCHGSRPHEPGIHDKNNDHTSKIACVTCHIPTYARGGKPTKIWWDWSTAGRKDANGKGITERDARGYLVYDTKKGSFDWGENLVPEYAWYSGNTRYKQLDETIDPNQVVAINTFDGSYDDPQARIWPFKVMRGRQAYDKGNNTLVQTHLFGKDSDAFWKSYDWGRAIKSAMAASGADYSGEYGFIETTYHWPLAHMVAPKEQALGCVDCHSRDGRLKDLGGFYMPGRDRSLWVDTLGWLMVLGSIGGVGLHGLGRMVMRKRREGNNG
ncbi:MAG: tetrathionate reductase family octaheme c-type cytochrome [Candidatus Thiodiazotropha sp.]